MAMQGQERSYRGRGRQSGSGKSGRVGDGRTEIAMREREGHTGAGEVRLGQGSQAGSGIAKQKQMQWRKIETILWGRNCYSCPRNRCRPAVHKYLCSILLRLLCGCHSSLNNVFTLKHLNT